MEKVRVEDQKRKAIVHHSCVVNWDILLGLLQLDILTLIHRFQAFSCLFLEKKRDGGGGGYMSRLETCIMTSKSRYETLCTRLLLPAGGAAKVLNVKIRTAPAPRAQCLNKSGKLQQVEWRINFFENADENGADPRMSPEPNRKGMLFSPFLAYDLYWTGLIRKYIRPVLKMKRCVLLWSQVLDCWQETISVVSDEVSATVKWVWHWSHIQNLSQ